MPSILIGTATVYAMDGRTLAFEGVATAQNEPTAMNLRDTFDKVDIKGRDGRTIARGAANRRHTVTVDVMWKNENVGATRAQADAVTKLPALFGKVTLGGFNNPLLDGDWNYEEGSIADGSGSERKATLTLARMEKSDGTMAYMAPVA